MLYIFACVIKFGEDDDLGGGLCHLWSSDHAFLVVEIITIIIMIESDEDDVKKESEQLFISSASKLRKMTQLQRKKNPIKTKHKEDEAAWPWTFFSLHITFLCLDALQNQMIWNNF